MQLSVFVWQKAPYSALAQSVEHAAVNRSVVGSSPTSGAIPVIMKQRIHLFPFRTQKLSSALPKVLCGTLHGRIGSCRISIKKSTYNICCKCFFMFKAEFTLQNCKVCCCFKLFTFYFIYAIIKLLITKSLPSDLCLVLRIIK